MYCLGHQVATTKGHGEVTLGVYFPFCTTAPKGADGEYFLWTT
jgi:hypothetical protein